MRRFLCNSLAFAAGLIFAGAAYAQSVEELVAVASPEQGERLYRQCQSCHTIDAGGPNRAGPNLYGVIGRPAASVDGFRYSPALQGLDEAWTLEALDAFISDPRAYAQGTRMGFRGVTEPGDRAAILAYLNQNSDTPLDLAATGDPGAQEVIAVEEDFGLMFVAEGVDVTYYSCTGCHSEMIVVQQGKSRENWDKLLDWMVDEQGMDELVPEDREIILDYLAAHYNTDRPNFPRN